MTECQFAIETVTFVLPSFIIWRIRRYERAESRNFRKIADESLSFRFAKCGFDDELQRLASNFDCLSGSRRSTLAESRHSVSQNALPMRNRMMLRRSLGGRTVPCFRGPYSPCRKSVSQIARATKSCQSLCQKSGGQRTGCFDPGQDVRKSVSQSERSIMLRRDLRRNLNASRTRVRQKEISL